MRPMRIFALTSSDQGKSALRTLRMVGLMTVALLALGLSAAAGQYPPVAGNVTLSLSNPSVSTGSTVIATVRIVDSQGHAVGGASCTASVSGGTGASVSPSSFTSNADGSFPLSVSTGSSAGSVSLSVSCGGSGASASISVSGDGTSSNAIAQHVQEFWARAFGWLRHLHGG